MLELIAPSVVSDERIVTWWRKYERMSATPNAAAAMLRANQQIDVRDILPSIHAPTLVLHRRDTLLVDSSAARHFADEIEGAQFRELPGADVFPYLGDQDAVLSEIEEFVTGTRQPPSSDRFLATMVFTDIVGSTDLAQSQGDARWRDTLDAHNKLAERLSASCGGRIVDTAGDGALAEFLGPTPTVEYAQASRPQSTSSVSECVWASTPEKSNAAAAISQASESTSELESQHSPRRTRYSSPAPSANSRSARN